MADDQDLWAQMGMPMSFGKQAKKKAIPRNFEQTKRSEADTPVIFTSMDDPDGKINTAAGLSGSHATGEVPSGSATPNIPESMKQEDDGEDSDFAEEEPEFDAGDTFPVTHEVLLKDHSKVVSALALDPSGARIVSGSYDYDCKLWDFGGMGGGAGEAKPFKTWEPAGTYYVHDLKFNPAGDQFLVISGTLQPKLFDREGNETAIYMKGDMYIRDMKHTAGHVGELTGCAWHPRDANTFITSSNDSTIRIWDVEDKRKQKTVIVVKSKERGTRTKVTTCAYSHDGKLIAGACLDGTLNLWPASSNFVRPSHTVYDAHVKGTETGSVVFSVDGHTVLSRGNDDFAKLWDVRSFKKPIFTSPKIPTLYPETNAAFSPDEKFIVTGSSASKTEGGPGRGGLVFLRRDGLDIEKQVDFDVNETVVKVVWHSKINQILCGLSTGAIRLLYSPNTSTNGAKLLLNKHRKRATIESYSASLLQPHIITPHALPMFRDDTDRMTKRKRERERDDPKKTRKPMPPISGPGRGGRVGASATQHVVQNLVRDSTRDEDPREALLKYADLAEKDPMFTGAWRENQPKPVFREEEEEEEG
ncbi:hypothetical protein FRB94_006182 [Tulasnella sp. JGI-2019a]|nr:hypothetical protein FRB94_006182 [Tulasnella sp. JGI-2019a]